MFFIMVREMSGLVRPYGFRSSSSSVGSSVARASDANVSMMRLTHSIWIALSGESCHIAVPAQSTLAAARQDIFARKLCMKINQNVRILHDICPTNTFNIFFGGDALLVACLPRLCLSRKRTVVNTGCEERRKTELCRQQTLVNFTGKPVGAVYFRSALYGAQRLTFSRHPNGVSSP